MVKGEHIETAVAATIRDIELVFQCPRCPKIQIICFGRAYGGRKPISLERKEVFCDSCRNTFSVSPIDPPETLNLGITYDK